MCLLGIALCHFVEHPLLVLANREEFYARPTAGPQIFPRQVDSPAWLGGIDLVAGGTWLGVNEFGLLVAVTNRKKSSSPENPPSRGLLCRSLLMFRETASAVDAARGELEANQYAGCNLMIADRDSACVIEAGDAFKMTPLPPGLHLLANAQLNSADDVRIRRVRKEFEDARATTADEWFRTAQHVCQLSADGAAPPICLAGPDRGTVSSTVLGIGRVPEASRYWYAPGPPNTTQYEDYTPLLRQLLRGEGGERFGESSTQAASSGRDAFPIPGIEPPEDSPARRAVRHSLTYGIKARAGSEDDAFAGEPSNSDYRILLRGPWQSEPIARVERDATGAVVWTTAALPAPTTVRLPASWQDLFGPFRGRVRFRRRFHTPSNVEPDDHLYIVFDGLVGVATISINGQFLGNVASPEGSTRFDVTGLLRTNNKLDIDLGFFEFSPDASPGGLIAPVALEIHES